MKLLRKFTAGLLFLASCNAIFGMNSVKLSIKHELDTETNTTLNYVGNTLENTGKYLAETGNSIAMTSKFLYETGTMAQNIVDKAISSTDSLLKNHLKKVENITTTVSNKF